MTDGGAVKYAPSSSFFSRALSRVVRLVTTVWLVAATSLVLLFASSHEAWCGVRKARAPAASQLAERETLRRAIPVRIYEL
mmetsp:Transcript_42535/g.96280  ORF Transcript_42535/g.96280 Transcript_42535/m.96280 type:complete len:81 (-) Transcript_42535:6-248(-)